MAHMYDTRALSYHKMLIASLDDLKLLMFGI
jgi:hypothetical protein